MNYLARLKARATDQKRQGNYPSKPSKAPFEGYDGDSGGRVLPFSSKLTEDEAERAALAADSVPAVYLDAWARMQCQRPVNVDPETWQQAVADAGLFLDRFGKQAAAWGWLPGDLFDVPDADRPGGFAWFIAGNTVTAFGPEHARLSDQRIFDRKERNAR